MCTYSRTAALPHEMPINVVHVDGGEEELVKHGGAKILVLKLVLGVAG